MVKKKQKLSRNDFSSLLKQGKRVHGSLFSLTYSKAQNVKVGVVVSKKVARKAVERNLLRRRVYAVLEKKIQDGVLSNVHLAVLPVLCAVLPRLRRLKMSLMHF